MGKANIISSVGNGLYQVELIKDVERLRVLLSVIDDSINNLVNTIIPDLTAAVSLAESEKDAAYTALQNKIDEYLLDPGKHSEVVAATAEYNQKLKNYSLSVSNLSKKNLDLGGARLRKDKISRSLTADRVVKFARCVDGQEDLSGIVGTIEIPGEVNRLKIQPGFFGQAAYNKLRDGILQPIGSSTPAGAFFNRAIFPGWQKHKPTYRTGTITSFTDRFDIINFYPEFRYFYYLSANVQLDDIRSSAQGLNINKFQSVKAEFSQYRNYSLDFTKIYWNTCFLGSDPYEYYFRNHWWMDYFFPRNVERINLDCLNYDIGDKVVVKFEDQSWSKAKIIGHENTPIVEPNAYTYRIKLIDENGIVKTPADLAHFEDTSGKVYPGICFVTWGLYYGVWPGADYIYNHNSGFFNVKPLSGDPYSFHVGPPWNRSRPNNNLWMPYTLLIASKKQQTPIPGGITLPLFDYVAGDFQLPWFPGFYELYACHQSFDCGSSNAFTFFNFGLYESTLTSFFWRKGYQLPFYGHETWGDVIHDGYIRDIGTVLRPYSGNLIIRDSNGIWHN